MNAMNDRDYSQGPSGTGFGIAALLLGAVVGAAALLLATKPGQRILEQVSGRAEDWKAQAAAAVAETREKVVSAVEAETPPSSDSSSDYGQRVRENL